MKQEDKELLLKDLCARLPYGVIMATPGGVTYTLNPVALNSLAISINGFAEDKPYLRPMSSMTEEEKKELCEASTIVFQNALDEDAIGYNPKTFAYHSSLIDYCLSHHLDFRGLIEKGLAIKAPEGMYKTE